MRESLCILRRVPRLWNETIDAHRRSVRDAALDATAELVTERGVASVTMSEIATRTGVGRATLYKYFPDVDSILVAWHERQVERHLALLTAAGERAGSPMDRIEIVLSAFARIAYESHGADPAAVLHRQPHVSHAQEHLTGFLADLLAEAAVSGDLRDDVAPRELATYCLHALGAAGSCTSQAAVRRLVDVTLAGLRRSARS
jgi:AcrR family transcriptional regulator